MSKEDLLKVLAECADSRDVEGAHSKADEALLEFINDDEIKEAFHAVERWYS